MAKKFIIKETYGLEEAGPSFMDRLRGAAAGFRGGTATIDTPSAGRAASAEELTRPKFDYTSPGSSKELFQLYNQLINPNSQVDASGNEIKPLVFSKMDQKDGKGYLYNLQGNNRQTDRQHFAQEYLDIVKNPESGPASLQDALTQLRGRVMTRNEAEHGSGDTDYSEVKNSYDQVKIALKTLVSQFKNIGLASTIISAIVEEILQAVRINKSSSMFTLKEARAPRPVTINISSEIADLDDAEKIKVVKILKNWVRTIHNFGNTEIAIKLHKDLESLIARPKETPASPTEPKSDDTSSTTGGESATTGSSSPAGTHSAPSDSPPPEVRTNAAGAEVAPEATTMDWDAFSDTNRRLEKIISKAHDAGDKNYRAELIGLVSDAIKYNNTAKEESEQILTKLADGFDREFTDEEYMLLKSVLEGLGLTNEVWRALIQQMVKSRAEGTLKEGLFDKFLKRKKQAPINAPYKMIGKNKFKLL